MEALVICLLICYFLGSMPSGYLLVKWFKGVDIRNYGSHNIGATNVWRTFGWKLGLPTLLLDFGKGLAAILIMVPLLLSGTSQGDWILAGAAAILGHVFPVGLKFKGGKGIATAAGVLLALMSTELFIALGVFVIVVALSRYVCLGSLLAVAAVDLTYMLKTTHWLRFPQAVFAHEQLYYTVLCIALFILVVYTHRKNIKRLVLGEESRIDFSKFFKSRESA